MMSRNLAADTVRTGRCLVVIVPRWQSSQAVGWQCGRPGLARTPNLIGHLGDPPGGARALAVLRRWSLCDGFMPRLATRCWTAAAGHIGHTAHFLFTGTVESRATVIVSIGAWEQYISEDWPPEGQCARGHASNVSEWRVALMDRTEPMSEDRTPTMHRAVACALLGAALARLVSDVPFRASCP